MRSVIAIAVALFVLSAPTLSQAADKTKWPKEVQLENLLQQVLDEEFTPGREIIVSLVVIPPNTTLERHWHPGEEFHYYLEGEATIEIEGMEPIVGKPGTVGHIPYRKMHSAKTGKQGARALVFRVHTAGEPVRHLESDEKSPR